MTIFYKYTTVSTIAGSQTKLNVHKCKRHYSAGNRRKKVGEGETWRGEPCSRVSRTSNINIYIYIKFGIGKGSQIAGPQLFCPFT